MGTLSLVRQNWPYLWINLLFLITHLYALCWPHGKENQINCKLPEQICLNPWSSKSYIYITYLRQMVLAPPSTQKVAQNFLILNKKITAVGHGFELILFIWFLEHGGRDNRMTSRKVQRSGEKVERNSFMLMKEFHFRLILSSANFRDWHMAYATDG